MYFSEFLSALAALVNCGSQVETQLNLNLTEFKRVFVQALSGENPQFLETGLHGFIALSRKPEDNDTSSKVSPDDFKLLIQIQRRPGSSSSVKNTIADFLSRQKKSIPAALQAQLNLSSNLEGKSELG